MKQLFFSKTDRVEGAGRRLVVVDWWLGRRRKERRWCFDRKSGGFQKGCFHLKRDFSVVTHDNFVKCEIFLDFCSPEVLTLFKANLDEATDSVIITRNKPWLGNMTAFECVPQIML